MPVFNHLFEVVKGSNFSIKNKQEDIGMEIEIDNES